MPRGCAPKMIPKGPDTLPTMVNASFLMEISSGLLPSCIGKASEKLTKATNFTVVLVMHVSHARTEGPKG